MRTGHGMRWLSYIKCAREPRIAIGPNIRKNEMMVYIYTTGSISKQQAPSNLIARRRRQRRRNLACLISFDASQNKDARRNHQKLWANIYQEKTVGRRIYKSNTTAAMSLFLDCLFSFR